MDIQDVALFAFILTGTLSAIGLMRWMRNRSAWLRVLCMLLAIFAVSSIDEHVSRLVFGTTRGTVFSRDFLITLCALLVYILVALYQTRELPRQPQAAPVTKKGEP